MNRICTICGAKENRFKKVYLHHISYEPPKTITLCAECHSAIHALGLKGENGFIELQKLLKLAELWYGKGIKPIDLLWDAICRWMNCGIEMKKFPRLSEIWDSL